MVALVKVINSRKGRYQSTPGGIWMYRIIPTRCMMAVYNDHQVSCAPTIEQGWLAMFDADRQEPCAVYHVVEHGPSLPCHAVDKHVSGEVIYEWAKFELVEFISPFSPRWAELEILANHLLDME